MRKTLYLFFLVFCCLGASAQTYTGYLYDAGSPAYTVQFPVENGFINVANGNLHLEFPISTAPQRGALSLRESLVYDSHWYRIGGKGIDPGYSNLYWWPDNLVRDSHLAAGWRFINGASTGDLSIGLLTPATQSCSDGSRYFQYTAKNYIWRDPAGTLHVFEGTLLYRTGACASPQGFQQDYQIAANDSSGLVLTAAMGSGADPKSVVIRTTGGQQVYPTIADRYGNFWTTNSNGDLVDDRGQAPVMTTYDDANHKIYFDVLRTDGGRARYTVTTVLVQPHTAFNEDGVAEYPNGDNARVLNAVQSIQLPDQSQYSFEYDPTYAMLTKVTLPTGGVITYGWSNFQDSYQNKNLWLTSRNAGGQAAYTFQPQVVTKCGSQEVDCHEKVVVTDPSGNDSVYDQRLNNGSWNTTFYKYIGSSQNGATPLLTNQTTYDFSTACGDSCTSGGSKWIVSSARTTTLNDVGFSQTQVMNYADASSGLVKSVQDYDFYNGSLPTKPTRQVMHEYAAVIPRDVISQTTTDGDGNVVSRERYTFTTAFKPTTAPTGHSSPPNPNVYLGAVSQWLNTDGSEINRWIQMDDAGTVLAVSTPFASGSANAWKSYGYDNTATFVMSSKEPSTPSGVDLTSQTGYDLYAGVPTSTTDYNNQSTTFSNFDWAGRPGHSSSPDNGSADYSYSPNSTTTISSVDGSRKRTTSENFDAFGRPTRQLVSNGQAGNPWYQQDTCYDTLGRVQAVSLPYAGTGGNQPANCAGTTYTYDGLGRPKTVTNADGAVTYSYRGRATSVTDVNGKQKITQVDALGRVVAVCEVSSESFAGDSPQACGLDIPGSGYLTTYAYNLANHTTTIKQGLQTRVSQTDSLGRTVYTSEPERGATLFSYAYGANGLVATRSRPQPDQTAVDRMIDQITSFDNLGRTLSVQYAYHPGNPNATSSFDPTMAVAKQFAYDKSDDPNGFGGSNLKGRMTAATAMAGSPYVNTYRYSYDQMGRLAQRSTCLPGWCGSPSTRSMKRTFHYNYAGDNVDQIWNYGYSSANNFPTVGMYMNYTIAGELDKICCGLNDGNMPQNPSIYGASSHTAFGTQAEQYGNGLYGTRMFDSLGRLIAKWICVGTTALQCDAKDGVNRHVEGYLRTVKGDRVTYLNNIMGHNYFSYDSLGRMTSSTPEGSGTPQLTWQYDRYGNRLNQHDVQNAGLPHVDLWYNQSNNQITGVNAPNNGYDTYDAAGNETGDSRHAYTHDLDGNVRCIDNCNNGSFLYDAFGRRVYRYMPQSSKTERFEYSEDGRISDVWCNEDQYECQARYYANGEMIGYWTPTPNTIHFQHDDYLGTMHARTFDTGPTNSNPNSAREGTGYSLPWGDGMRYTAGDGTSAATDGSDAHFAGLEHDQVDLYSDTEQALHRTYVAAQGSWLEPDPSDDSYDATDPQSFNRYSYVKNNPLALSDPTGLDGVDSTVSFISGCAGAVLQGGLDPYADVGCAVQSILSALEFGLFSGPSFHGSVTPRPSSSQVWTDHSDFYVPTANLGSVNGILNAAGIGGAGCEFGVCASQLGFGQEPITTTAGVAICIEAEPCGIVLGIAISGMLVTHEIEMRRQWTCTASCNLQSSGVNPPQQRVTGTASGPSQDIACTAAKRVATQSAPPGTYARHCQCSCSK